MFKMLILILSLMTICTAGEAELLIKRMGRIYAQERCWALCNLVTEMPMDTAIGYNKNTEYLNVDGYGAVVAIVDKTKIVVRTWMVGISYWTCGKSSKKYRVHYYKKNSNNILYEIRRINIK